MKLLTTILAIGLMGLTAAPKDQSERIFARENLVAWCIVPFDAAKRGPEERASMLQSLGITKVAYDWRDKDIPTFDDEITALQERGIQLHAFWCPIYTLNPQDEKSVRTILDLLKRRQVVTQLWVTLDQGALANMDISNRVEAASRAIGELAREAGKIGCSVGLYNHGGWFGDVRNQIAIIKALNMPNIGIVYNFHHGHQDMDQFSVLFANMQPYLLTVNLNGMRAGGPMILPLGAGDRELQMLRIISQSGYSGPIGILDHQSERDTREVLQENLDGLQRLRQRLKD